MSDGSMSAEVGSLIVRMALALNDEGIGPVNPQDGDSAILVEAARISVDVAGVTEHDLWDAGLVDAEQHDPVDLRAVHHAAVAARGATPPSEDPLAGCTRP